MPHLTGTMAASSAEIKVMVWISTVIFTFTVTVYDRKSEIYVCTKLLATTHITSSISFIAIKNWV